MKPLQSTLAHVLSFLLILQVSGCGIDRELRILQDSVSETLGNDTERGLHGGFAFDNRRGTIDFSDGASAKFHAIVGEKTDLDTAYGKPIAVKLRQNKLESGETVILYNFLPNSTSEYICSLYYKIPSAAEESDIELTKLYLENIIRKIVEKYQAAAAS